MHLPTGVTRTGAAKTITPSDQRSRFRWVWLRSVNSTRSAGIASRKESIFIQIFWLPLHSKVGTYDHRVWRTGLPVRSAVLKPHAGRLVVGWVTTSESRLLYVFASFLLLLRLMSTSWVQVIGVMPLESRVSVGVRLRQCPWTGP